jgi:hypothetical protein
VTAASTRSRSPTTSLGFSAPSTHALRPARQPRAHSFQRGGPVAGYDDLVEANLHALRAEVDVVAAREVWSAALAAGREMSPA